MDVEDGDNHKEPETDQRSDVDIELLTIYVPGPVGNDKDRQEGDREKTVEMGMETDYDPDERETLSEMVCDMDEEKELPKKRKRVPQMRTPTCPSHKSGARIYKE